MTSTTKEALIKSVRGELVEPRTEGLTDSYGIFRSPFDGSTSSPLRANGSRNLSFPKLSSWTLVLLLSLLILSACASGPKRDPAFASTRPAAPTPSFKNPGSIYQHGIGVALFEDVKAKRIGDMLTVVLVESTNASKTASTTTKKENTIEVNSTNLLGSTTQFDTPGFVPLTNNKGNSLNVDLDSAKEFTGEGDSSQGNSLQGNIAVTVAEVLPNGNLVVRGEKLFTLNQGDEHIRVSGIVRPVDIRSDNTVLSTQLADAQIIYAGRGAVSDSNNMGWLSRIFNSKWWPF